MRRRLAPALLLICWLPPAAPARDRYALLLNGDSEDRHKRNIVEAYGTLRTLGFEPDHIYTLTPQDRRLHLPANVPRLSPNPNEFWRIADTLVKRAKPGDLLVVYATGHGDTEDGESLVDLRHGELWARDFRDEIDRWRGDAVIVMDQCFSGGFADALAGTRTRTMIVTTVDARHETDCSVFAHTFWDALRKLKSVRQAFQVADRAHRKSLADDPELKASASCRSFNGFEDAGLN